MKQQQNFSTKLGIIPQGWHIKRLGEICTHFQSGTSITSKQLKKMGNTLYMGVTDYEVTLTNIRMMDLIY